MPFSYTLVFLQAGKHRLFLNIFLCGKLQVPISRPPVCWPPSSLQIPPERDPPSSEASEFSLIIPYLYYPAFLILSAYMLAEIQRFFQQPDTEHCQPAVAVRCFAGVPRPLFTFLYYYKTFLPNPQQDLLSGITFQKIESFIIVSLSLLC